MLSPRAEKGTMPAQSRKREQDSRKTREQHIRNVLPIDRDER